MTTLARYREAHATTTGCAHDNSSCKCRECECRGIWSPATHGYKCEDSCSWVNMLYAFPEAEPALEDYEHAPIPGPYLVDSERTVAIPPDTSGPRLWWYTENRCIYCGDDSMVTDEETGLLGPSGYSIHEDGHMTGLEYPLCRGCGAASEPTCDEIWEFIRLKKAKGPPPGYSPFPGVEIKPMTPPPGFTLEPCSKCAGTGRTPFESPCRRCLGGGRLVIPSPP